MISIVLYGRNDNYGYNLHKRAALSLNCMAEVLSDPADEILFVDYNTPDDFPTFPEAIQDTLTDKAKRHLRILRVRPSVHARFASRTHLVALEPVARNVAVRRSNPANRWILSTNTDMVFVPRKGQSLSETVRDLPKGHYGIPRFEVPETLWESVDRLNARAVIEAFDRWGWDLHLNEIVAGMSPFLFDGPGDFQLMERADLFAFHGFHEEMLLGWHVDANIAKRFSMVYGHVGDLSAQIFGYHCDHTRQVTPAHRRDAVENNPEEFFHRVERPELPEQAESWGCPADEVEEVRLEGATGGVFIDTLNALLKTPLSTPLQRSYTPDFYDRCGYAPEHVLPFLIDLFASMPRTCSVAWFGQRGRMFELFVEAWAGLGFTSPILIAGELATLGNLEGEAHVNLLTLEEVEATADAFIFDFARENGEPLIPVPHEHDWLLARAMLSCFHRLVDAEEERQRQKEMPRRFIGINAIHNRFERAFSSHINVARTPFSVRIRHGFINPPNLDEAGVEWLPNMLPGTAGVRDGKIIRSRSNTAGHVTYGPYAHPLPGKYKVSIDLEYDRISAPGENGIEQAVRRVLGNVGNRFPYGPVDWKKSAMSAQRLDVNIEIAAGDDVITSLQLNGIDVATSSYSLVFDVASALSMSGTPDAIEVRIHSNGAAEFRVTRVVAQRLGPQAPLSHRIKRLSPAFSKEH
ncbi:hypothetical protein [Microvirga brassicacearum]|uniref:Uncharacterized protein n=1 Tax=Microvirga brassicacearum TaxID=2580413 RepID=A0A5N3PJ58_9HYPH|nr:hypothetical protein [Microvirga brassicacearum]KAB0269713.1 hypothetical protein FEZ63_00120 [Microvirga brassicacearum]